MTYKIVIFPSQHIQDEADALRKRYDPEYPNIAPHITIKSNFALTDVTEKDIIQSLETIAKQMETFPIHLSKVSSFYPVTNTIYFKIEPTNALTTLFEKTHHGIFPNQHQYSFVPHITIAQDLLNDEYSDVFGSLQISEISFDDVIDRFHLCYKQDDGTWSIKQTFIFKQNEKENT